MFKMRILEYGKRVRCTRLSLNLQFSYSTVEIDGKLKSSKLLEETANELSPLRVPPELTQLKKSGNLVISRTVLQHLQWMIQRDLLGQDVVLFGHSPALQRWITMHFLELTQRKHEYVAMDRDSQNNLEQRLAVQNGTHRAVTHNKVLVIDNIGNLKRGALQSLNEFCNSRRMVLENGHTLIPCKKFDNVYKDYGTNALKQYGFIRVPENFRVIAMGSTIPKNLHVLPDSSNERGLQANEINYSTKLKQEDMQYYRDHLDKLADDEEITMAPLIYDGQRTKLQKYAKSIGLQTIMDSSDDERLITFRKKPVSISKMSNTTPVQFTLGVKSAQRIADFVAKLSSDVVQQKTNESQGITGELFPFMIGDFRSKTELTVPPRAKPSKNIHTVRSTLPIYEYRDAILAAINQHQVVVISGGTGSGKTTQVPQYIMEEYSQRNEKCRIICTQPRRLAATSIASRVSHERNDRLGNSVGYQIRLDRRIKPTTNLIFTTFGFLLRCITGSKGNDAFKDITHLIIDEVHEREKVCDFLLIAIKNALRANPNMKVILMSATLDTEQFSSYFDACPVIDIPGRTFDVDISYLGDIVKMTGHESYSNQISVNEGTLNGSSTTLAAPENDDLDVLELFEYQSKNIQPIEIDHQLLSRLIMHIHTEKPTDGSILVFLPGHEDIMEQKYNIESRLDRESYELFVLHSAVNGISSADQARVFERMPQGIRKIILSTNIAETSLTINDVVYVIDAGKVKQLSYNSITGSTCLASTDISQACAKQRAGRAGRVQNGFCYRLYSVEQFEAMDKYTTPEIFRAPLTEISLNAKMLAHDLSIEEYLRQALQPPPVENIRQSIELLKTIDALDEKENLTHLGLRLANLPIDCQYGKMILYAILMRCLDPVVTIVSILSVKDPFVLPINGDRGQVKRVKRKFSENSISDHRMLLKTFETWSQHRNEELDQFCDENCISNKDMKMVQAVRRHILQHLQIAGFICDTENSMRGAGKLNENAQSWAVVKACLAAGIYPNVCRITSPKTRIHSRHDKKLVPHFSSVLRAQKEPSQLDSNVVDAGAKWLMYSEQSTHMYKQMLRNVTPIADIDVILFARSSSSNQTGNCDTDTAMDDSGEVVFNADEWIQFTMDKRSADLLLQLRQRFTTLFSKYLQDPVAFEMSWEDEETINVLREIIENEDGIEDYVRKMQNIESGNEYKNDCINEQNNC